MICAISPRSSPDRRDPRVAFGWIARARGSESSGDAPALRAWTLRATGSAGRGRFGSDGSARRPRFLIASASHRAQH